MDFKILNNLSFHKQYQKLDNVTRKDYNPYLMNRGFSYFADTVLQANAMNLRSHLDKQAQYDYLFYSIRKRKRFSKWHKKENLDIVPYIKELLDCSPREAEQYAKLISQEMAEEVRGIYGGTKRKPK